MFSFFRRRSNQRDQPDQPATLTEVATSDAAAAASPFAALLAGEVPSAQAINDDAAVEPDTFSFTPHRMPRSTVGLYYPADGVFMARHPEDDRTGLICQFGPQQSGQMPLTGDWNGDGLHGLGLYDPAHGLFVLRDKMSSGTPDFQFLFGPAGAGWLPLVGDWDGDGVSSVGLYDPAQGAFLLTNRLAGGDAELSFLFGPPHSGWLPIVGDWNGTGNQSVGLYNPVDGYFYLRNSLQDGWDVDEEIRFGPENSNWLPLCGDWNGSGRSSVGLFDPNTGTFHLRTSTTPGEPARIFCFGPKMPDLIPFSAIWF